MKNLPLGELFKTARDVQVLLVNAAVEFCFIGGLAVQRWGRVRVTKDVDLTLFAGFGQEARYLQLLQSKFRARRDDFQAFALAYRIALLEDDNGVGIDVSLGALPFEAEMIARASNFEFAPEYNLRTCSAEDLIILKAYADRDQDWFDIRNVIVRFGKSLNQDLIFSIVAQLAELKGEPQIVVRLKKLFDNLANQPLS